MSSETYSRSVIAQELGSAGVHSATLQLGYGTWEILSLGVIIGGDVTIVTTTTVRGIGDVRFENDYQQDGSYKSTKGAQRLLAGACTILTPMIMDHATIVVGPGQVKSYIQQDASAQHTMTVVFRRVLTY